MDTSAPYSNAIRRTSLKLKIESLVPKIEDLMKIGNTPGLSISVICENETIFERGFGYADINKKIQADEFTIYPIASISKGFAAAACGILVAEGKLSWSEFIHPELYTIIAQWMLTCSRHTPKTLPQAL
jgi:CubicO group peptidase (beta-lactamase class C family)